jgi:sugar lactone lactonase YvrE
MHTKPVFLPALGATLICTLLSACGGGGGDDAAVTPPVTPPPVAQTVELGVSGSTMLGAAPVTLNATLGRAADVSWSLGAGQPGALSAASGGSVSYTPPAARVGAITPVTVTATSAGVSQSVRLALYPDPGAPGLSLLAGSLGGHAIIDGAGADARFNQIAAIAADDGGGFIVADLGDDTGGGVTLQYPTAIRQVSAAGVVGTLISPAFGHADGTGAQARLGKVASVAIAPDRSIYLIDNDGSDSYLRRLTRDGTLSTIAPLKPTLNFSGGAKVVVDSGGRVTVLSWLTAYTVSNGALVRLAGGEEGGDGSVDGTGAAARFSYINDAVVDRDGNIYIIDAHSIRKLTRTGVVSTVAGVAASDGANNAIDGVGNAARFGNALSLSLNAAGNLLVLDRDSYAGRGGYLVRQVTPGGVVTTPYSGADPANYGVLAPANTQTANGLISVSGGAIVLASKGELRSQQNAGGATVLAGLEGDNGKDKDGQGAAARFTTPIALAADLSGNVFVLQRPTGGGSGHQIEAGGIILRKISLAGEVGTIPIDTGLVASGIAADGEGNVFISSRWALGTLTGIAPGGVIYKVTPQGAVSTLAGGTAASGTPVAPVDGTGAAAVFTQPALNGIDAAGNLYVTDSNTYVTPNKISYRKITPKGEVSTIAALPAGLGKAPDGYTYVADRYASVVYRVAGDGAKTVAAGQLNVRGTRLGALPGGLDTPNGVVPTGPGSFAVISGSAVLRLVLPH